jgi:8-oxo-dGTP diphosphatase
MGVGSSMFVSKYDSSTTRQHIAAKAVITDSAGRVLVMRQCDEAEVDGAGKCHLPGGIVELGETLFDAAVREVFEETTLVVKAVKNLDVSEWQSNIRGTMCFFVGVFIECEIVSGELQVGDIESTEYVWVDKSNIDMVDVLEPSKSVIKKYLQV